MSLILELQTILSVIQLLAEIPDGIGKLINSVEELISKESDPGKKAVLEERLAAIKKDSEVA